MGIDPLREPTHLIRRDMPALESGSPLFRLGTYDVVRGVVRAPGVWLVESTGPQEEPVLLQIIHCTATSKENHKSFERYLSQQTAQLLKQERLTMIAHGGVRRRDDTRVYYWALPWPQDSERVLDPPGYISGPDHLISTGLHLASILQQRHAQGTYDPLLSEHLLIVRDDSVEYLGVPICVPRSRLTDDMMAPRVAPEEEKSAKPEAYGDIWRLGHALTALSSRFSTVPERLAALLEHMTRRDPSERLASMSEVRDGLLDIQTRLKTIRFHPPEIAPRAPIDQAQISALVRAQFWQESDALLDAPTQPVSMREEEVKDPDPLDDAPTRPTHRSPTHRSPTPNEILDRVAKRSPTIRDPAEQPTPTVKNQIPLVVPRPVLGEARTPTVSSYESSEASAPSGVTLKLRRSTTRSSIVFAGVLGVLLGATGLRLFDRMTVPPAPVFVATPANELMIGASPPSAVVISERDGLILGPVPLMMMVPPGIDVAVLITARGYEPQRLVLPDRGSISTNLLRLPPDAEPCAVDLPQSSGAHYEGIEADIGSDTNFTVHGAAVVRIPGEGAWAVRCPSLGGGDLTVHRRTLPTVSLTIEAPSGPKVFMNGGEVGVAPLRRAVRGAFTEVMLREGDRTLTRWIPTIRPVAVSLSLDR